jgi:hypothetical protein
MKTDTTTYRQRQILLVAVGLVVFSEPFLGIVRSDAMVFGLPITMVALFGQWLAVIVSIAWIMRSDPAQGAALDAAPDSVPRPVSEYGTEGTGMR